MLNYGAVIVSHNHFLDLNESNLFAEVQLIFAHLVVVDNVACSKLSALCHERGVDYIANSHLEGYSCNANRGANYLLDNYEVDGLAFINPDVEINSLSHRNKQKFDSIPCLCIPNTVDESGVLIDVFRPYPSLTRILEKSLKLMIGMKFNDHGSDKKNFFWAPGFFLMMNKKVFNLCGGFDEGYRLYLEDCDICCALWSLGYHVEIFGDLEVRHKGGFLSRRIFSTEFWWHIRSYLRFWFKWGLLGFRGLHGK